MKKIFPFVCLFLFVLVVHAVAGMNEFESCRCNDGIATKGDSKQDVQQKCGTPVRVQYGASRDCAEMWLYNFGPNEFMQGICFDRNAQVKKVLSLTRGY